MEPSVSKQIRAGSAYFSIRWSRLLPLEKDVVIRKIPSTAGIYEVYRYAGGPTAEIIGRSRAYYGGLRNTLRGLIDPISPYPLNGELLPQNERHLVRYSLTESSEDMNDILFFFAGRDNCEDPDQEHSGRYQYIYVKDILPESIPNEVTPAQ
ncbi:MAG: hypothetical protein KOO61_06940 [Spirochaetales bacterium]|nr:hypothetical protein [Spirochaetales bacterium]